MDQQKYIELIIKFLNGNTKEPENINLEKINEAEIDVVSVNIFQQIYNNLLYFNKTGQKNKNNSKEQKYFYDEIVNILNIIHEVDPSLFLISDFLKGVLIYLISFFKESININIEIVLKIFSEFPNLFTYIITHKKIEEEIHNFEKNIVETIKSLINRYIMVEQIEMENLDKIDNFVDLMKSIRNILPLPLYLDGFKNYIRLTNQDKFFIIKIYKFFELKNPFETEDEKLFYNLYQGYSLHGILSYKKVVDINFKQFHFIKVNRVNDENAKVILELAIKLLNEKSYNKLIDFLIKQKMDWNDEPPKISKNFDNTKEYYKDLYEQLKYFLFQYTKDPKKKILKISLQNFTRILWLNFLKLLLLYLNQNDIEKNEIKIIFYFIVNLFNPNIGSSPLEFRDTAVPILFFQSRITDTILDAQEIYKNIDKNYSQYYSISGDNFLQMFINSINDEILNNPEVIEYMGKNEKNKYELENLIKYNKILPFPLLKEYLKKNNVSTSIQDSNKPLILIDFYRNCFCDVEDEDKKEFIKAIRKITISNNNENLIDINRIILEETFINLIKEIMLSPVMDDAYKRISEWYEANGKFDLYDENAFNLKEGKEEKKEMNKEDDKKNQKSEKNLICGETLYYYYKEYCKNIQDFDYSNLFIVMGLPEAIKGFTFRFLKIILNFQGIKYSSLNVTNKNDLLKAYLVFVIIHEQNHYIKRFLKINIKSDLCKTPKINDGNDEGEGGKQLIKLLFGDALINKCLNFKQAKYIIDIENWKNKSVFEFRRGFLNISSENSEESSIVYLSSEINSICDHSKL